MNRRRLKRILLACPGFEAACRMLTRKHVRALLYHRFRHDSDGDRRRLSGSLMQWQAAYLARHHAPWDPDRHLQAVLGERRPGGRCPVVVTVDDGYRDFLEVAFPIFHSAGVPVMFFVVSSFIDGESWFWWDKIDHILEQTVSRPESLDLGSQTIEVDLSSLDGRLLAWQTINDHCRFLPDQEKDRLIEALAAALQVELPPRPPDRYAPVTWDELGAMVQQGLFVGAHTVSHPILSRVGIDEARRQIHESQDVLAHRLGVSIDWFCYPQGEPVDFTPEVRRLVAERYRGCYVAYQPSEDSRDPFTLPRYGASADRLDFRWKLCGAEYLALRLRRLFRIPVGTTVGSNSAYGGVHQSVKQTRLGDDG